MHHRTDLRGFKIVSAWRAVVALSCGLIAGSGVAGAVECGEVLTQDTALEADLICPGDGLIVGADGIVIDLGGHLLSGSRTRIVSGTAGIRNEGHHGVELRNGRIEQFQHGVDLAAVTGNRIEALRLNYWDCGGGGRAIVAVESDQNHIVGNEILRPCGDGIVLIDSHRNRIEGNTSEGARNGAGIALIHSDYNEVVDNHAGGDENALRLQGDHNLVRGNGLSGGDGHGMLVSGSDNRVIGNSVGGARLTNLAIAGSRNIASGNQVSLGEDGPGLTVSGQSNRIESNFIQLHAWGDSLAVSGSHNRIARNAVVGIRREWGRCPIGDPEVGIRVSRGVGNRLTENSVTEHCYDAILVEGTASQTRLLRNLVADNGDDGIHVEDPTARIVGNTALGNADYGIEAVPGVRGGRNRALGNGNPDQCLNITCR
jgi:parallel beta-helix repeat protein